MLKVWNVSLVLATGTLAIMGTFLVRSGVLNSIHAFGGATLGVPFVALIGVLIAGSIYLVVSRRDMLRSEHRLDSLLSRESVFLANNLVLVGALLRDLLGHLLPADLRGADRPRSLGRAAVVRPLHGAAGAGARAAQRHRAGDRVAARDARQRAAQLRRAAAQRARDAGRAARGGRRAQAASRSRCSAVRRSCSAASGRSSCAARARAGRWPARPPPVALLALVRRNRRRYGGYIVHVGIAVLFVGVAASSSFQHAVELRPHAGLLDARRRLHAALRAPDRDGDAEERPRAHRLDAEPRRGARRQQARTPRRDAAPQRGLLRLRRTGPGHRRASDRRPAGQPHQHERRRHARRLDARSRRTSQRRRSRASSRVGNRTLPRRRGRSSRSACLARDLPAAPAAGAVPLHRLAAGHVDLDRRPDRLRRRPDRDLAGARAPCAAAWRCARARAARTAWRAPELVDDATAGPSVRGGC